MARLTPRFSANRAVREYTEQHYLPAASNYSKRAADKGASGRQMTNWRHALEQQWGALRSVKCGLRLRASSTYLRFSLSR